MVVPGDPPVLMCVFFFQGSDMKTSYDNGLP